MAWEYKAVEVGGFMVQWDEVVRRRLAALNQAGAEGWELASVQNAPGAGDIVFFFRRQK